MIERTIRVVDGRVVSDTDNANPAPTRGPQRIAGQSIQYGTALARWIAAGRPTRDQHEIDEILAICQSCPHYRSGSRPQCDICGCSINRRDGGMRNKIAMATEHCPDDPARW